MNRGYRVIVCSWRGCNGSKLNTKRMCDSSNYQDTHVIIDYISKKYPSASKKFLLGYSMGAMISIIYATKYDDIDGVISVSHVIDNKKADIRIFERLRYFLYGKPLFFSLVRSIKKVIFIQMKK
jgi:predicted alpha/beta-fold hydrolase